MDQQPYDDNDQRVRLYREAIERMIRGDYDISFPDGTMDEAGCLGEAVESLAQVLKRNAQEQERLNAITASINAGLTLDDVLERVYDDFREIIPFNRIGFSLLEQGGTVLRAYWAKSDLPEMLVAKDYTASMAGSSLERILKTGEPRIINDLEQYLAAKPNSESTRLLVQEGIRSSLTCPLIANGVPVGFMFFSSSTPGAYSSAHATTFQRIAGQLSVILEKGRLVSALAAEKAAYQEQAEELKNLDDLKNRFLGMASHDLRGPISTLRIGLDVLLHSIPPLHGEELEKFIQTYSQAIDRQTSHMLNLLNDLLDVNQIESGNLNIKLSSFEMRQFLEETIGFYQAGAATKGTQVALASVPDGKAVADIVRLRQVLDNLLSNAIKYSPAGSTITVSAEERERDWKLSVADQGPGVTEEDQRRLFKDFGRGSARPTGGERSIGLGLAIARRIVEAHGGKIGVHPGEQGGAVFWFTLPC